MGPRDLGRGVHAELVGQAPAELFEDPDPGFVRVLDERTLAFPNYDDGNGMYLSTGNLSEKPNVGLLLIDLERGRRLRVSGVASIDEDDELAAAYQGA